MNTREAGQIIRDTVSMDTVLGLYGYQARHGFMVCPFHGDRDASLRIYSGTGGWHCFGCGRGGSVIDFVMEQEGCNFSTAVNALNHALGLRLFEDCDPLEDQHRRRFLSLTEALADNLDEQIVLLQRIHEESITLAMKKLQKIEGKPVQDREPHEWTDMLELTGEMEYLQYKIEKLEEIKQEVIEWRKKTRRRPAARKARSA